jgi:ABC-type branched-subunit amino acid transport system ATPase component
VPISRGNRNQAAPAGGRAGQAALTVTGLAAGYGDTPTIIDVDLTVHRGEIVTVVGPNGAGRARCSRPCSGSCGPCRGPSGSGTGN